MTSVGQQQQLKATAPWRVLGKSVRGAAHERKNSPNQDAICWIPKSGRGKSVVLSLADGHGSDRYTRSHIGSQLAVSTSTQLIADFLAGQAAAGNLSLIKRAAEQWLPQALVREWTRAIKEHLSANPFSEAELDRFATGSSAITPSDHAATIVPYGSTLVVAAVTEDFILYLQIGDGEVVIVSDGGEVSQPLVKDERLFANETTSLCAVDAWRDFRVSFQPITREKPALILLATDGYPNSFREEAGFLKAGGDILHTLRAEGASKVRDNLESWLVHSTTAGSGDDVTLGILYSVKPPTVQRPPKSAGTAKRSRGR